MKVHQTYSYVNLEWLLYGKGEMLASAESASLVSSNGDYQPSLFDENPVKFDQKRRFGLEKSQGNCIKRH